MNFYSTMPNTYRFVPRNSFSSAVKFRWSLIAVIFLIACGCSERRYRPAAWQSMGDNQELARSNPQSNDLLLANSTLPRRSSGNSTLPSRNPGRSSTLPNRTNRNSTLPGRSTTLPDRNGSLRNSTLPARNLDRNATLPARSSALPQRDPRSTNRASTLPQ